MNLSYFRSATVNLIIPIHCRYYGVKTARTASALKFDPKKDFKFFIARSKVQQVYREALKEASLFEDPSVAEEMRQLMKDEFDVFRRQRDQNLDVERIDYYLAIIRKKINSIKELRDRVK